MATLTEAVLASLLEPYLREPVEGTGTEPGALAPEKLLSLYGSLSLYLDLLLQWNSRTNLTAVRSPEQIVTRHFGESLFAARCAVSVGISGEVLDFGSGAGFPGIPLQLYLPELRVTLAESQGKKAAFLRAVLRELGQENEVWGGRVDGMPLSRQFDLVAMRAVDDPGRAKAEALQRVRPGGWLLEMVSLAEPAGVADGGFVSAIPGTRDGAVVLSRKA